jgi:SAM-dependent methyltransferase
MSIPNEELLFKSKEIIDFYKGHLKDHGDSAKGVGWKNEEAQIIRFKQLSKIFQGKENFSVNDFGCGTGEFYKFLLSTGCTNVFYSGYDILPEMVTAATLKVEPNDKAKFHKINSPVEIHKADYSIASGVFNVKYQATDSEWESYVLSTLGALNDKSRIGFSVNFLTSYSDKEFMQAYLYYADPLFLFDYCKKNFSKNVALLHDYDQYDFTILVRKAS